MPVDNVFIYQIAFLRWRGRVFCIIFYLGTSLWPSHAGKEGSARVNINIQGIVATNGPELSTVTWQAASCDSVGGAECFVVSVETEYWCGQNGQTRARRFLFHPVNSATVTVLLTRQLADCARVSGDECLQLLTCMLPPLTLMAVPTYLFWCRKPLPSALSHSSHHILCSSYLTYIEMSSWNSKQRLCTFQKHSQHVQIQPVTALYKDFVMRNASHHSLKGETKVPINIPRHNMVISVTNCT